MHGGYELGPRRRGVTRCLEEPAGVERSIQRKYIVHPDIDRLAVGCSDELEQLIF